LRGRSSQERSRDDRRRVYEREYLEIDRDPRVRVIEASHDPRSEDRITAAVYRDDDERDRFRSTSRVREISELPPNGRRSRVPVLRVGETRPNSEVATSDRRDADPTWRRR
jgi:hypothetical protein